MSRREAERLEEALQRQTRGEPIEGRMVSLLDTTHRLRQLASSPPPAPRALAPGRQRFLAEAARLRASRAVQHERRGVSPRAMRLGVAAALLLVVLGILLATEQAVASSLPGSPLYGLKLAAENARLSVLTDPQARANLFLAHAERRLDEIISLLEKSRVVEDADVRRTEEQWEQAMEAASRLDQPDAAFALQQMAMAIQHRQPALTTLAGPNPEPLLRELLREMERIRQEAHLGQGIPEGQQERNRSGEPADPTGLPIPSRTPFPPRTSQPTPRPDRTSLPSHTPYWTARPSVTPNPSSTPYRTGMPSETAQASQTPHPSGTPARTAEPSMTPQASQTPHRTAEPSVTPPGGGGGGGNGSP